VLTRLPGLALGASAALLVGLTGGRRALGGFSLGFAALAVPWWLWRLSSRDDPGFLEAYYLSYEPSAWVRLLDNPAFTADVVLANSRFFLHASPLVFGWPGPVIAILGVVLAAVGIWRLRSTRSAHLIGLWFAASFAVLLGHPYPMARYLVPFVIAFCVLVAAGTAAIRARLEPLALPRVVPLVPVLVLLAVDGTWLRHFGRVTTTTASSDGPCLIRRPDFRLSWSGYARTRPPTAGLRPLMMRSMRCIPGGGLSGRGFTGPKITHPDMAPTWLSLRTRRWSSRSSIASRCATSSSIRCSNMGRVSTDGGS
jgi:hypothetical protein